jgi:hypothetical protein
MLYVPFYYTPGVFDVSGDGLTEDKDRASRIFENMRKDKGTGRSTILIGSQRVNYLVEYMVADLFNCVPFVPADKEPKVPFYLCYRKFDRLVPSCFGGQENPPGETGENGNGTYYLYENFKWQFLEWQRKITDAGIVIIIREADTVEMAAFGFSGRSTNAICNALLQKYEYFWPENGTGESCTVIARGKEIGIYICHVEFSEQNTKSEDWAYENFENDVVKVIPLNRKVLKKFLNKG